MDLQWVTGSPRMQYNSVSELQMGFIKAPLNHLFFMKMFS
ncbi:hypothetical protein CLOSTASPAR_00833 [[Clostridium] asparagiforme DSM 15981]|uniref:Uncharacterized protein n=1 Tax=[Clostridium] asparagiforme DSM 15981 TaxID=518636 RepID=C0CV32_9FIRM|nr:hypothetical protein CLOSTASPAR_00833 [[Clostridium] asparagiforme DSM 15981]